MCLPIAVLYPELLLATGEHLGFEWNITHNSMGYRCGYVRVPKGHPWHGVQFDVGETREGFAEPEAHGGITFSKPDMACDKGGADDAWWIGFDCARYCDLPDPSLPSDEAGKAIQKFYADTPVRPGSAVRTQEYVEAECRSLCEQANAAATVARTSHLEP